uniref:Uncharacterized protein n=1 Tax=Lactuca sativa TaxID=4236 RepID=A0A9R1UGR9_LACSA|nr:hypothetical protein LSAT_V11C900459360 [Lactuca sativa]
MSTRFTYSHLAQLKFILPEGIEIKKILVRDERTSCMKPELDVTLNFSIIQDDEKLKSESKNILMTKLFRSRLVSYYKSNPEGDEVPEGMLPEPFNQSSCVLSSNAMKNPNLGSVQDTVSQLQPLVASHMPQSFKRRFSKQVSDNSSAKVACVSIAPSPVQKCSNLPETPIKSFSKNGNISSIDGTPAKLFSTPMSATPAQAVRMPVRSLITPDEEDSIMSPTKSVPNKLTRRSGVRRLFDTPVKNKTPSVKIASSSSSDDDSLCDILSGDLFASIKEKERKAKEENDPAISHAKWRKQMIAGHHKRGAHTHNNLMPFGNC